MSDTLTTAQRHARILELARMGYPQKAIARMVGFASQSWVSEVCRRNGVSVRATDDPARLAKRAKWVEWQRRHRAKA